MQLALMWLLYIEDAIINLWIEKKTCCIKLRIYYPIQIAAMSIELAV